MERALLRLAGDWIAAGRQVTIVAGDVSGPLAGELPDGVNLVRLDTSDYRRLAIALPGIVRTCAPDILFCPGNHYTAIAAWTRLRLGRCAPPIVAKVSNSLVRGDMGRVKAASYRRWLRLHPRFIAHAVAMTPGMAREATSAMAMPAERMSVIANPLPLAATGSASLTLPEGRYLLGVGRLAPQKRWDRAIAALAQVADRDVHLVILGEGSERARLAAQAEALNLTDRVRLSGYAIEPGPAIAGAAAVVLTSDFEGVPGVLREALAAGTPVVTTDSSVAVREIVASPDQGDVVACDDAAGLVAALDGWLAPGRARPARAEATGDPASDYLAVFDELVSKRRP